MPHIVFQPYWTTKGSNSVDAEKETLMKKFAWTSLSIAFLLGTPFIAESFFHASQGEDDPYGGVEIQTLSEIEELLSWVEGGAAEEGLAEVEDARFGIGT